MASTLSYRARFRLAWELTWPLAAMDLAVVLVIHGLIDAQDETADSVWAVVAFFIASPWVIRRAFKQTYEGWQIVVERASKDGTMLYGSLRYQESLKVMWLLAWRSLVLGLGALLLVSLAVRGAGVSTARLAGASPFMNALGLSAVDAVTSLAFTPLLVGVMLRKRYKGFRLQLQTQTQPAEQPKKPVPTKSTKKARRART